MRTVQNTLYVMTPNAYVHVDNTTVRVDVDKEKKLQVPLHHIGSVVTFGNVMVSPALMHSLADTGKSLVMLDDAGRFKARLEGTVSGNVVLRQAQYSKAADAPFSLELARTIVAGKLKNSRSVIMRGGRESDDRSDAESLSSSPSRPARPRGLKLLGASSRVVGWAKAAGRAHQSDGRAALRPSYDSATA